MEFGGTSVLSGAASMRPDLKSGGFDESLLEFIIIWGSGGKVQADFQVGKIIHWGRSPRYDEKAKSRVALVAINLMQLYYESTLASEDSSCGD